MIPPALRRFSAILRVCMPMVAAAIVGCAFGGGGGQSAPDVADFNIDGDFSGDPEISYSGNQCPDSPPDDAGPLPVDLSIKVTENSISIRYAGEQLSGTLNGRGEFTIPLDLPGEASAGCGEYFAELRGRIEETGNAYTAALQATVGDQCCTMTQAGVFTENAVAGGPAAGTLGGACLAGNTCNTSLVCNQYSGVCESAGAEGEGEAQGKGELGAHNPDVDLGNLSAGETVTLVAPPATTLGQATVTDCDCSWSVAPDRAFAFVPNPGCTTSYTPQSADTRVSVSVVCVDVYSGDEYEYTFGQMVAVSAVYCSRDGDCDDGLFCNGRERCDHGYDGLASCWAGDSPCAEGQVCDDAADQCIGGFCTDDTDCDDGLFCNGAETCNVDTDGAGECVSGSDPCADTYCGGGVYPICQERGIASRCLCPGSTGSSGN